MTYLSDTRRLLLEQRERQRRLLRGAPDPWFRKPIADHTLTPDELAEKRLRDAADTYLATPGLLEVMEARAADAVLLVARNAVNSLGDIAGLGAGDVISTLGQHGTAPRLEQRGMLGAAALFVVAAVAADRLAEDGYQEPRSPTGE